MKSYLEAKNAYIIDHLAKQLVQPQRRISALEAIEAKIRQFQPELLKGDNLFKSMDRASFAVKYEKWKGSSLSGAEKSVMKGLFDFSD